MKLMPTRSLAAHRSNLNPLTVLDGPILSAIKLIVLGRSKAPRLIGQP